MKIKGMIFAAGLGTRLKPFTLRHPKAMVPIGGIPMLERVIKSLSNIGITEIIINVHHFADEIVQYVASHDFGDVNIFISREDEQLLDTGGGIVHARKWLEDADAVLIHNADILSDVDLAKLIADHEASDSEVTLLVAERDTSRYLYFEKETRRLKGWCDIRNGATKPSGFTPSEKKMIQRAYSGIHIFNTSILGLLNSYKEKNGDVFSIIPFYVDNCNNIDIRYYQQKDNYLWLDIGKPENVEKAGKLMN